MVLVEIGTVAMVMEANVPSRPSSQPLVVVTDHLRALRVGHTQTNTCGEQDGGRFFYRIDGLKVQIRQ